MLYVTIDIKAHEQRLQKKKKKKKKKNAKFQLHPPIASEEKSFVFCFCFFFVCEFSFSVAMATYQIKRFGQDSYGW